MGLGILLKILGFGKILLGFAWDAIKGIFKFASEKPFQFLTIALAAALLITGWFAYGTSQKLTATQKIVDEKVLFIEGQNKTIKEYVKALDVEKKNHVSDIRRGNDAVASIKKSADAALARAQEAAREALKDKAKFDKLGSDYGRSNPSTGKPQDRIKREEATNDSFIKEWKKSQ